jgi:hypothetical protein
MVDAKPLTVAVANKALKAAGYAEKLVRGRGYYYFVDGCAFEWYSSSVMTNSIAGWTVEQIIAERNALASDWRNS